MMLLEETLSTGASLLPSGPLKSVPPRPRSELPVLELATAWLAENCDAVMVVVPALAIAPPLPPLSAAPPLALLPLAVTRVRLAMPLPLSAAAPLPTL